MAIRKDGDKWKVDLWPWGRRGKRVRKWFNTKVEAQRFERYILSKAHTDKDWNPSSSDKRSLKELIEIWFRLKGVHLKDGERRKRCLIDIAEWLGDPIAKELKPSEFLNYLAIKKESGRSDKTLNNYLGYLNAVYNNLFRMEEIQYENPLARIEMIKIDERELSWLTGEQIDTLLETIEEFSLNPHVLIITKICLATGARWGEAESLKLRHLNSNKITFSKTKSGKSRTIPIDAQLFSELVLHLEKWDEFTSSIGAFRRALSASKITLPKGQAAHVLRHSFASHFMMNGGSILTLQKILGHSTINMTMRYAHLSPDHLMDAILLNPLFGAA